MHGNSIFFCLFGGRDIHHALIRVFRVKRRFLLCKTAAVDQSHSASGYHSAHYHAVKTFRIKEHFFLIPVICTVYIQLSIHILINRSEYPSGKLKAYQSKASAGPDLTIRSCFTGRYINTGHRTGTFHKLIHI